MLNINTMEKAVYFYGDYKLKNDKQLKELQKRYHTVKDLENYLASITAINVKTDRPLIAFINWLERFA